MLSATSFEATDRASAGVGVARVSPGPSPQLLEAAVAGMVLGFNPRDSEMRAQATVAWEGIHALLADDVLADRASAAPWAHDESNFPRSTTELLKKRYAELRSLAHLIKAVSFESSTDSEVSVAGRALCRLAVCLDDLINGGDR